MPTIDRPMFSGPLVAIGIFFCCLAVQATGQLHDMAGTFEGFAEPIRKINLASDETGAIFQLLVEEGQTIAQAQVVARLDSRVQQLQLEIAEQLTKGRSHITALEEELKKRVEIREKLFQLRSQGHASASEVIRADMELAVAKSKLLAALEELEIRELERQRADVQFRRRTITAPFEGVITRIHTREGEFLSPMNPEVVTLSQIDQLIVRLNIPLSSLSLFETGQVFTVHLSGGRTILATVDQIGVEINPESETVEVKLVIDNANRQMRSGEKIILAI